MQKAKKREIWDELLELEPILVSLEQIYLDPNNPRIEFPGKVKVPDARITEDRIQEHCNQEIRERGIGDLIESIKTSGFWTVDRIVLRKLNSDKYVVVEGNRRIATLKTLKEIHEKGKVTLVSKIYRGILQFEALLYKGTNPDIAWIIQGFRHTPGIKGWGKYSKSKFLAEFEKESKRSPQKIASIFGMRRNEVTHLLRSYYAFEQAKEDEDYGDVLDEEKFGHFEQIILRKNELKEWMGWDDKQRRFTKTDNLKKYLLWAIPGEEEKAKIDISPDTRDILSELVQPENKRLLQKFELGELNIRECAEELFKEESKREPIDIPGIIVKLQEMKNMINTLPIPQLQKAKSKEECEQRSQLCRILEEMREILQLQIRNLKRG